MSPNEFERQHKQEPAPAACNQKGCAEAPAYRFTWPGSDEAVICEGHSGKLRAVAAGMGMHIQLIPLGLERDK